MGEMVKSNQLMLRIPDLESGQEYPSLCSQNSFLCCGECCSSFRRSTE